MCLGLGNVGTAVALRARAFGFQIQYFDPDVPDGKGQGLGITKASVYTTYIM